MRENKLKSLWQENKTAVNGWLTIPSVWTAEVLTQTGFDALTIDMQHGLADYQVAVAMLQAISATDVVPLVRVPWNEPAAIMRILDAGAYGIICPMINNRGDAEAFVGACRYPPSGYRSYGPIRAHLYGDDDYFAHANDAILTLAMIETMEALGNLDEILTVEGLDGVYVGTVDLSISMGLADLGNLDNTQLKRALKKIQAATAKFNRVAGIHAQMPGNAAALSEWGFRLITPVNDTNVLRTGVEKILQQARREIDSEYDLSTSIA